MRSFLIIILAGAGLLSKACGAPVDAQDLDDAFSAIQNGYTVPDGHIMLETTVSIGNCTGVIIGRRHILTASHCKPRVGVTYPRFYDGVAINPVDLGHNVVEVWERFGVVDENEWYDSNDDYADFAVLKLDADIPGLARPAILPYWQEPVHASVLAVGQGNHDGNSNSNDRLKYRSNQIRYYQDGTLNTENDITNPGDSGGPLYTDWDSVPVVHGVLWGNYYDASGAGYRNRYTSTYHHRMNIAEGMGHIYSNNYDKVGGDYSVRTNYSWNHCVITCMQSSRCDGYVYDSAANVCHLKDSLSGSTVTASGKIYGRKRSSACTADSTGICRI